MDIKNKLQYNIIIDNNIANLVKYYKSFGFQIVETSPHQNGETGINGKPLSKAPYLNSGHLAVRWFRHYFCI
jgi:hypothetical protein